MVLGTKPGTAIVVPTRRDSRLMEGINSGAVIGSKRDVEGLPWLALADSQNLPSTHRNGRGCY